MLTYALVGAVCGLLGAAVDRGGARLGCHRAAALLAGGMMIAVGVAAVLRAVGVRLPQVPLPGLIQRLVLAGQRAAFALRPLPRALCIGLLTAFLPCGWLYLFASYAAGTGSPLWGALFMIAFWLGSVPALLLAGVGVQTLARLLGRRLPLVTALAIVVLGVVTLVLRMQTPVQAFEPVAESKRMPRRSSRSKSLAKRFRRVAGSMPRRLSRSVFHRTDCPSRAAHPRGDSSRSQQVWCMLMIDRRSRAAPAGPDPAAVPLSISLQ